MHQRLVRTEAEMGDMIMSIKCGESDTTSGLGSCPTTSQAVDRWVEAGGTVFFGETSELTGGEHLIADRCIDDACRNLFQTTYDNYIKVIEANRCKPAWFTANTRKHRWWFNN
jgi:(2R)-sulfolactate sulfo-lyase subunit beta